MLAVPVLAWAGLLFWLSAQPGSTYQKIGTASVTHIPGRDYIVHFCLYAVFGGLLWLWARSGMRISKPIAAAVAVGFAVLYGVSDEWHQSFVPGRSPDARDVLADAAGALVAVLVLWALTRYWNRRSRLSPPSACSRWSACLTA